MTQRTIAIVFGTAAAAAAHPPNPHFRGVGDLPGGAFDSRALGVVYHTNSGITVVGESEGANGIRAFRWSPAAGMESLGVLEPGHTFSSAKAVSYWNGSIVVGSSGNSPSDTQAFYWTTLDGMDPVAPITGGTTSVAFALVDDVAVACVGQGRTSVGTVAFMGGVISNGALPSLGGLPEESAALDVSWNGGFKVGYSRDTDGNIQAVRWGPSWTPTGIGFLNTAGPRESRARGISHHELVIVGESTSPNGPMEAFRLDLVAGGSMVGLGDLPGGEFRSAALAVSGVSSVMPGPPGVHAVVGWSDASDGQRAFVWTQADGMRDLNTVLAASGYPVSGWILRSATAISAKGRAIAGFGINPLGQTEGWVAYTPCYADCNGDLLRNVSDFGCFQTRFVAGDPYADCNEDGVFTVADFGCFQTVFTSTTSCNE